MPQKKINFHKKSLYMATTITNARVESTGYKHHISYFWYFNQNNKKGVSEENPFNYQ
jgi:hypothetical protein